MKNLITLFICLVTLSSFAQGGIWNAAKAEVAQLQTEKAQLEIEKDELTTRALSTEFFGAIRGIDINGLVLTNGVSAEDEAVLQANTNSNIFLNARPYRFTITSNGLSDFVLSSRYIYNLQANYAGATQMPDAPANATLVDYWYDYQTHLNGDSIGDVGINDVPTTWRNMTGVFRFQFERNELTEAQQLGIIDGIEREILAGMGQSYTSTSTTARYIDFQSALSGANDDITKPELEARGWTTINASQSFKFFNDINGTARRWRVFHN
jgi:hypothetical protein